jgi:peroxiredoxin
MRIVVAFIGFILCINTAKSQITLYPDKPVPGDSLRVIYERVEPLIDSMDFLTIGLFTINSEYEMEAGFVTADYVNGYYTAMLVMPDSALCGLITFCPNEDIFDFDLEHIHFPAYTREEEMPVKNGYLSLLRFIQNPMIPNFFEQGGEQFFIRSELYFYPERWKETEFVRLYCTYMDPLNRPENFTRQLELFISDIRPDEDRSENELNDLIVIADLLNEDKLESNLKKTALRRFPTGFQAQKETFDEFRNSYTLRNKEKLYQMYALDFEKSRELFFLDQMSRNMALEYLISDWDKFVMYANKVKDPLTKVQLYNSAALTMGGLERFSNKDIDLNKAEILQKEAIDEFTELASDLSNTPPDLIQLYWRKINQEYFARLAFNYSLIHYKKNAYRKALRYGAMAVMNSSFKVATFIERYVSYYEYVYGSQQTLPLLRTLIRTNHATDLMKDHFILLSSRLVTSKREAYEELARLEDEAKKYERRDLYDQLLDIPAPDFELYNTKGEVVRLSDFRGKTVILDFWATWSNPCLESFPGMQMAVSTYASNDNVQFLFINTFERPGKVERRIAKIMADGGYSFEILLDSNSQVSRLFNIRAIPQRIIIGPDGLIRFAHSGYRENPVQLRDEIVLMIDILQTGLQ